MSFLSRFDQFHTMASAAMGGVDDFGPDDYREPMRRLLSDLDDHPVYNAMGLQSITESIVGLLVSRLMLYRGLHDYPSTTETAIERPVFIIGMARSGTTVLHRILTEDPATQSLPFWLANMPMPRPPRNTWEANPVYQQVRESLESSELINEQTRAIHPISADQADECRWALDPTFWSSTMALSTATPRYRDWFLHANANYAYAHHRKLLQLVGLGDRRRWVLKDPSHMTGIDALLATYPDACIVQTHREPVECMRSIANLAAQPRLRRETHLDLEEYGRRTVDCWAEALKKMERVRRQHDPAQFIDFHISETRNDILGCIERIYSHFNLPVTDAARQAWDRQLTADPNVGHSQQHIPPDFGISADYVRDRLGDYNQRYLQVCEQAGYVKKAS